MKRISIYLILSILVAVGLALFLVQATVCNVNTFWYNAVGNVASALLVTGVISLLYELIMRAQHDKDVERLFHISESIIKSGLENIYTDSSKYDYTPLINNAKEFYAIMNDGFRWVCNNSVELEKRFNVENSITEFYLVDPGSDFCRSLATKTSVEVDSLKEKIEKTVKELKSTYNKSEKKGILKIYYLKNYPTQSIFYSDKKVVTTPYQTSSGRSVIPLFEYTSFEHKESIAGHLNKDLGIVRAESTLIWDSTASNPA